jgi:HEAT repeat protein
MHQHHWALEHGHIPATVATIPQFDLEKYYTALRKRYGVLALEGLTPPQKEEYLQIQLRSVFVEQSVREDPPPIELPKEVWEKLSHDKEIHSEDLPSGITLDGVRKARESYYEKPLRPVLDMLTDSRCQYTIVLGDPGSGKSTMAHYVILSLVDPSLSDAKLQKVFAGNLPLLIELRTYIGACAEGNCGSFLEFLEYLGKTEGWALTQAALHNHLKNDGRAVVIFDGLDEIFDPEQREQITRQIVGFCNDYTKARIIVTSRVIGYRRKILTDAGFTHFTLQDLDEKQVESFVARWYDLAMSDRPDEAKERRVRILKSFQDSASIRQLAGNPMLLTIMAIIGKHQELPRERWKLYEHAASVLIQHWDVNKHLKNESIEADFIGEDDKKELLRRLAFRMQGGDGGLAGNYIHREGLQADFESYLKERYSQTPDRAKVIAEAMVQQFRERNFILSLYGANLYGFVHRAFLEYFCASAFVYKFEKTKELTIEQLKTDVYGKHWEDQGWHEVLRLICGMIDEKWVGYITDFLSVGGGRSWPKEFNERNIPWNTILAIQCLGEVRNLSGITPHASSLLRIICLLLDHGMSIQSFFFEHIMPTVNAIGPIWPGRRYLIEWSKSRSFFSPSQHYARCFGGFVGVVGTGIGELYNLLVGYADKKDIDFSLPALRALAAGWKDAPYLVKLISGCIERDDEFLRWGAVLSISEDLRGDQRFKPIIDKILLDDRFSTSSEDLVDWILDFRDEPQTLTSLRKWSVDSPSSSIRSATVSVLAKHFHEDAQTLPLLRERAVKDNGADVRSAAVSALAEHYRDDPQTLPLLRERVVNDDGPSVRRAAMSALAEHYRDDPQILPLLRERAVKDNGADVRRAAVSALAEHYRDDPQTLPLLRERAVKDDDENVRRAAVSALAEHYLDDPQTLPLLREWAVKYEHTDVRRAAVNALAEHFRADPQTLPLLRERAVKDSDADVRSAAVSALGENFHDDPETLPLLRERAVNDDGPSVRNAAVSALAEHYRDDPQTLPLLREWAVKSVHADVRRAAVSALIDQYRTDPQTLPLLRERAVNDDGPSVRSAAMSALINHYRTDPQTLPLLRERAVKEVENVRSAAVSALIDHYRDDPQTLPLLRERAVNDESPKPNDEKQAWHAYVRQIAIDAIAKYWPTHPETMTLLRDRVKNDPTPWLRERSKELIAELEGKKAES